CRISRLSCRRSCLSRLTSCAEAPAAPSALITAAVATAFCHVRIAFSLRQTSTFSTPDAFVSMSRRLARTVCAWRVPRRITIAIAPLFRRRVTPAQRDTPDWLRLGRTIGSTASPRGLPPFGDAVCHVSGQQSTDDSEACHATYA